MVTATAGGGEAWPTWPPLCSPLPPAQGTITKCRAPGPRSIRFNALLSHSVGNQPAPRALLHPPGPSHPTCLSLTTCIKHRCGSGRGRTMTSSPRRLRCHSLRAGSPTSHAPPKSAPPSSRGVLKRLGEENIHQKSELKRQPQVNKSPPKGASSARWSISPPRDVPRVPSKSAHPASRTDRVQLDRAMAAAGREVTGRESSPTLEGMKGKVGGAPQLCTQAPLQGWSGCPSFPGKDVSSSHRHLPLPVSTRLFRGRADCSDPASRSRGLHPRQQFCPGQYPPSLPNRCSA